MSNEPAFRGTSRVGLYVMVFATLLKSCAIESDVERIHDEIREVKSSAGRLEAAVLKVYVAENATP